MNKYQKILMTTAVSIIGFIFGGFFPTIVNKYIPSSIGEFVYIAVGFGLSFCLIKIWRM